MPVRRLTDTIVNQIAAGEVIERPASVVRELLDNAVDAGATRIDITTAGGGKHLIRVTDNGSGMDDEDLQLAVQRHCTSKLTDNLNDIRSLGFRGEALPSIGSVARLKLVSRSQGSPDAWEISVEGGDVGPLKPAALTEGTIIEVADLFYATPARLKFLKTERAESNAITDVVRHAALARPDIRFSLSGSDRQTLDFPAAKGSDQLAVRAAHVLGDDFLPNALAIDAEREGVRLTGFAGLSLLRRRNQRR